MITVWGHGPEKFLSPFASLQLSILRIILFKKKTLWHSTLKSKKCSGYSDTNWYRIKPSGWSWLIQLQYDNEIVQVDCIWSVFQTNLDVHTEEIVHKKSSSRLFIYLYIINYILLFFIYILFIYLFIIYLFIYITWLSCVHAHFFAWFSSGSYLGLSAGTVNEAAVTQRLFNTTLSEMHRTSPSLKILGILSCKDRARKESEGKVR